MGKYSSLARTAYKLVSAKGTDATITRTGKTFDPVAQTMTGGTVTATVKAVRKSKAKSFASGSLTISNDASYIIAMNQPPFEPALGDILNFGGAALRISTVESIDPAGDGAIVVLADAG